MIGTPQHPPSPQRHPNINRSPLRVQSQRPVKSSPQPLVLEVDHLGGRIIVNRIGIVVLATCFFILLLVLSCTRFSSVPLWTVTLLVLSRIAILLFQNRVLVDVGNSKSNSVVLELYSHDKVTKMLGKQQGSKLGLIFDQLLRDQGRHIVFLIIQSIWGVFAIYWFFQLLFGMEITEEMLLTPCPTYSKKETNWCLDGDYLFLVFAGALVSLQAAIKYIMQQGYRLKFPIIQQSRWFRIKDRIPTVISTAMKDSAYVIITYFIFSFFLYSTLQDLVGDFLEWLFGTPVVVEPLSNYGIGTLFQLLPCALMVQLVFIVPNHILEVILTHHYTFSVLHRHDALLDVLTYKRSPLIQHLAFLDLCVVANFSYARRAFLFNDASGDSWKKVLNACCDIIDNIPTTIHEIQKEEALEARQQNVVPLRLLYRLSHKLEEGLRGFGLIKRRDPFSQLQLQIWAIEAVTKLTVASVNEDSIGVVQNCNTLPTLLNSMIACLISLEDYVASGKGLSDIKLQYKIHPDLQVTRLPTLALITTLQTNIYQVVTTFYEALPNFKFPPSYAHKLQSFADFNK